MIVRINVYSLRVSTMYYFVREFGPVRIDISELVIPIDTLMSKFGV